MLGVEIALLTMTSRLLLVCYRDLNVIYVMFTNNVISLRESNIFIRSSIEIS